jgi:hypothetical protein
LPNRMLDRAFADPATSARRSLIRSGLIRL